MFIDIREESDDIVDKIIFGHNTFLKASVSDNLSIYLTDLDNVTVYIKKTDILNLIRALKKAQEIW